MATGGDILEVTFNHPTIGSGRFFPKAQEDSTLNFGGFRSADDKGMIDGGGNMIDQMNNNRWSAEMVVANDNLISLDLENAVALAQSPVLADYTISHVSGAIYSGKGKPVGDLDGNFNKATFTLKLQGSGQLKKQ
ncbi:MAG TPA: hypothetical protein VN922_19575 [Bacteroidia bacterium]|nr:hypothetical protein [Bacteroidia bacterium]